MAKYYKSSANVIMFFFVIIAFQIFYPVTRVEAASLYRLNDLVDMVKKSPAYLASVEAANASKYGLSAARKFPNPSLGFDTGYGWSDDKRGMEYSVSLQQPLVWPNVWKYKTGMARDEMKAAKEMAKSAKLDAVSKIREHFYRMLYIERRYQLQKKYLSSIRAMLPLMQRQGNTILNEMNAEKLNEEMISCENNMRDTALALSKERFAMDTLFGGKLGNNFDVEGNFKTMDKRYVLKHIVNVAKSANPLLAVKEYEMRYYEDSASLEKAKRMPDISVDFSYGEEIDRNGLSGGLSFKIPLWNSNSANVAMANSIKMQKKYENDDYENEFFSNLKVIFEGCRVISKKERSSNRVVRKSRRVYDLSRLLYKQGKLDVFGFIQAKRDLLMVKDSRNGMLRDESICLSKLDALAGNKI